MGLISKLKLLVKSARPVGRFISEIKGAKTKYKTIPFWVTITGSAISIVASLSGFIPATAGIVTTGLLTAAYNILRGLDKADQEGIKTTLKSTEFWVGAFGILSTQLMDMQTAGVNSQVLISINTFIATAMALAQNLGAQQPEDVKKMNNEVIQ